MFKRLVDIIDSLASHNLALTGHRECLITDEDTRKSGNVIIDLSKSKTVTGEAIVRVTEAQYYSFLLDCTRDSCKVEQMSVMLKFCNTSPEIIEENLIGFLAVTETNGEYLTTGVLGKKWLQYSELLLLRIRQWSKYGTRK